MSWVIASIPFWGVGILLLWLAASALGHAYSAKGLAKPQEEWNTVMGGILLIAMAAGVMFYIAAKVAS